jgi:hypothetical protein
MAAQNVTTLTGMGRLKRRLKGKEVTRFQSAMGLIVLCARVIRKMFFGEMLKQLRVPKSNCLFRQIPKESQAQKTIVGFILI